MQHLGELIGVDRKSASLALSKCGCRKMVSRVDATQMVQNGFAQWVVLDRRPIAQDEICHVCGGGDTKQSCQNCQGFGIVSKVFYIDSCTAEHIVLVNAPCKDEKGREIFSPVSSKQTPRVATIEQAHIERSYVYGNETERKRIELYGFLTLMARVMFGKDKTIVPVKLEPPDDEEKGTGRRYDWGRTIFSALKDERTPGGFSK